MVIDDAHGGDYIYEWLDAKQPRVDICTTNYEGRPHTFKGTPEEKMFYDHIKTLPAVSFHDLPGEMEMTPDIFVAQLVEGYEANQQLKRWCKKKTVCVAKGCAEGQFITFNVAFSPEVKQAILKRNSDILEFVNERFL